MKIVDLFCGAGIGAAGAIENGDEVIFAVDNDPWAVKAYNKNISNVAQLMDIRKLDIKSIPSDYDVLLATPTCKSFSVAGAGRGFDDEKSGDLIYYFSYILQYTMPKAFFFENVAGMVSKKHEEEFKSAVKEIEEYGYNITYEVLNCADYGVPQDRKRLFMVGIRKDINKQFSFPSVVENKMTLRDAIYDIKDQENQKQTLELGYSPRFLKRNRQRQWDEQSYTIVSEARHMPLYPEPANYDFRYKDINAEQPPRRFTVRECLRIQTCPDWFEFPEDMPLKNQYIRCSGIPSLFSKKVFEQIKKCITED
jgi:DNA (cytosine-5)-methyltransferase 1